MVQMSVVYKGEKRCELTHGPSGTRIETDAPRDNAGKGESFSPTDLVAAALASCIVTTMAIMAEKEGAASDAPDLRGVSVDVVKEMTSAPPRRIARLAVKVLMPGGLSFQWRRKLESAAYGCPVHRSLGPDVDAPIEFIYPDEALP